MVGFATTPLAIIVWRSAEAKQDSRQHPLPNILHPCLHASLTMSASSSEDSGEDLAQPVLGILPGKVERFLLKTLRPSTQVVYGRALFGFKAELERRGASWASMSAEHRDVFLAEHLVEQYEAGARLQAHVLLVASVQKVSPMDRFPVSWAIVKGWRSEVPVRQAPAAPRDVALGIAAFGVCRGFVAEGTALLLCFCGLLRVGEAIALQVQDVRVLSRAVVLVLAVTKRGTEQKVVLHHPGVVEWMRRFAHHRAHQPWARSSASWLHTSYYRVSKLIKRGAAELGFEDLGLSSHSFRRGGATELLRGGIDVSSICLFGRWASESSAREYLRKGEVFLTRCEGRFAPASWSRALQFAALGAASFDVCAKLNVES